MLAGYKNNWKSHLILGKKGSRASMSWDEEDQKAFEEIKKGYAPDYAYNESTPTNPSY